jgi:ligand-binding sensor domain-containing protein
MSAPSPSQPRRPWGLRAAIGGAAVFAVVAAWPYLTATSIMLAQGESISPDAVKHQVAHAEKMAKKKMEMQKDKNGHADKPIEAKGVLALADGSLLLGTKTGIATLRDGELKIDKRFPGDEVRSLALAPDGSIWAASKDGVWNRSGDEWIKRHSGDFHGVHVAANGSVAIAGKPGVISATDGRSFVLVKGSPKPHSEEKMKGDDHHHDENAKDKEGKYGKGDKDGKPAKKDADHKE